MLKHLPLAAAIVVATAAYMAPSDAGAINFRQNATGVCQSNLPTSDTQIRKRPTAIRNEGTSSAFVSCSLGAENAVTNTNVEILFTNVSAAAVDVSCTFVTGRVNTGPQFYPVTVNIAGNSDDFVSEVFPEADLANLVNASCLLPPGVELNYLHTFGG